MPRKPHKRSWTNWKFGDFILQLATVVIGILITFGGSALIQRGVERRQARHLLGMVGSELERNIFLLERQRDYLKNEFIAARAMMPYIRQPLSTPPDTIVKYHYVVNNITHNHALNSALEVLKNSPQVEAFGDKELLFSIFDTYQWMDSYYNNLYGSFTESKQRGGDLYFDQVDLPIVEAIYRHTAQDYVLIFADMMQHNSTLRNYIISTAGGNCESFIPQADTLIARIGRVMARIDNKVNR